MQKYVFDTILLQIKEKQVASTKLQTLFLLTYYKQDALTELNTSIQRDLSIGIHYNCRSIMNISLNIKVISAPLGAATFVAKRIQQKQALRSDLLNN